jgi:hypothetical protein
LSPQNPLVAFRGVHRALRDTVLELCDAIITAIEKYAEWSVSPAFGVDFDVIPTELIPRAKRQRNFSIKTSPSKPTSTHSFDPSIAGRKH